MVGHDDSDLAVRQRLDLGLDPFQLLLVDSPALDDQRARGVDAKDRDLVVDVPGGQIAGDDALVAVQGLKQPAIEIVGGNIVVSGEDQLRPG